MVATVTSIIRPFFRQGLRSVSAGTQPRVAVWPSVRCVPGGVRPPAVVGAGALAVVDDTAAGDCAAALDAAAPVVAGAAWVLLELLHAASAGKATAAMAAA